MFTMHETSYGAPIIHGEETVITVGKYTSIANSVVLDGGMQHNHRMVTSYPLWRLSGGIKKYDQRRGPIEIGSDVWIGDGALIMSGLRIEDGAVIGARSVVTRSVPPYAIVAGSPAIVRGYRFGPDIIEELLKIKWWDWSMEKVMENAGLLLSHDLQGFIEKHKRTELCTTR